MTYFFEAEFVRLVNGFWGRGDLGPNELTSNAKLQFLGRSDDDGGDLYSRLSKES